MLRTTLDGLYRVCGYLAAFFLAAIGVLVIAQIVGRFAAVAIDAIEVSGFCMAAATFLGLAATFKHGAHIRVNLVIRGLQGTAKRLVELWCTGAAAIGVGYFAYQTVLMVWDTYRFGEMTKGLIIIDLWIPQSAMALGLAVLAIALADEFARILRGAEPAYEAEDVFAHPEDSL